MLIVPAECGFQVGGLEPLRRHRNPQFGDVEVQTAAAFVEGQGVLRRIDLHQHVARPDYVAHVMPHPDGVARDLRRHRDFVEPAERTDHRDRSLHFPDRDGSSRHGDRRAVGGGRLARFRSLVGRLSGAVVGGFGLRAAPFVSVCPTQAANCTRRDEQDGANRQSNHDAAKRYIPGGRHNSFRQEGHEEACLADGLVSQPILDGLCLRFKGCSIWPAPVVLPASVALSTIRGMTWSMAVGIFPQ